MARLRIRVELSRGGEGVPLQKLASVIEEAQKFFVMLGEDIQVDTGKGEWLGLDFEHDSLNFTAEYVGPVTPEQVQAFNEAFAGTTSLRRATIGQFARITDVIGEEEVIGFGLYQSDEVAEPTEWRCLSRRDALRITEEIQLLLGTTGEFDRESHLPTVQDHEKAARIFGERREQGLEQTRWVEYVREMESSISNRLTRIENKVEKHSGLINDLRSQTASTEESFRGLLSAVENFCDQAAHQIERVSPGLPAASGGGGRMTRKWALVGLAGVVAVALAVWLASDHSLPLVSRAAETSSTPPPAVVHTAPPADATRVAPKASVNPEVSRTPASSGSSGAATEASTAISPSPAAATHKEMRIDLEANDAAWISLSDASGKVLLSDVLQPGTPRTVTLAGSGTLRTGNAGGLTVRLDGKPIGAIGPAGQIRDVEFKDGAFTITTPK